jgi:hypothetical protein
MAIATYDDHHKEFLVTCGFCVGCYGRGPTKELAEHRADALGVQTLPVTLPDGSLHTINVCSYDVERTVENLIDWHDR